MGFIILSRASNILHAITLDYYRNKFLDYAFNRDATLGESLEEFERELEKFNESGGNYFERLIIWIYIKYSALQSNASSSSNDKKIIKYNREDY